MAELPFDEDDDEFLESAFAADKASDYIDEDAETEEDAARAWAASRAKDAARMHAANQQALQGIFGSQSSKPPPPPYSPPPSSPDSDLAFAMDAVSSPESFTGGSLAGSDIGDIPLIDDVVDAFRGAPGDRRDISEHEAAVAAAMDPDEAEDLRSSRLGAGAGAGTRTRGSLRYFGGAAKPVMDDFDETQLSPGAYDEMLDEGIRSRALNDPSYRTVMMGSPDERAAIRQRRKKDQVRAAKQDRRDEEREQDEIARSDLDKIMRRGGPDSVHIMERGFADWRKTNRLPNNFFKGSRGERKAHRDYPGRKGPPKALAKRAKKVKGDPDRPVGSLKAYEGKGKKKRR